MEWIIKPRGLGKTSDLIRLAAENDIPILTATNSEYILNIARNKGYNITVFTINDLKSNKQRGRNIREMYVDEVDAVLNMLLNSDFNVTATLGTLTIKG
jgi:predicted ATPase